VVGTLLGGGVDLLSQDLAIRTLSFSRVASNGIPEGVMPLSMEILSARLVKRWLLANNTRWP
jgi:hypothetical protein